MRAMVYESYGSPDGLELRELPKPVPADDELLVRVRAASINPYDWHMLTGAPYVARISGGLRAPKRTILGVDFAGTVEAVGRDVTRFRPGDEVFGGRNGALAEYLCVREQRAVAPKPPNVSFEQAAAAPVAAVTALQGLRDKGRLQPGQKVLINGASGGVGTFAVQIAKALGAEVTGVCSTRNVDTVRSLGADHVVDYTREDFTTNGQRFHVVLDNVGSRPWSELSRVLEPGAIVVVCGGPKTNRWIGPLDHSVKMRLASVRGSAKVAFFLAKLNPGDLAVLQELLAAGTVVPVIDRRHELSEAAEALRYLGEGHSRGKVVIAV